jgi:glycosyltransferase involved in cell wall biosynthesis
MQSQETQFKHLPLEKPIRITEQVWPEGTIPVVSVFCITYNHENFIRDAIEGFLMQETTFPVGIFIHDDASTDSTAKIVTEYAERYPNLFWTVLQTENQWSKGNRKFLIDYLIKQRGEFIALCEGDDYWTTNDKLQMQVQYLVSYPYAAGVFHRGSVVNEIGEKMPFWWDNRNYEKTFSQEDCIFKLKSAYPTASLVFRREKLLKSKLPYYFIKEPCDFNLDILLTENGDLHFLDFEGSAYRQHLGGIWSSTTKLKQKINMCSRYIALLQTRNIKNKYKKELHAELKKCYTEIWWLYFEKKTLIAWFKSIFKCMFLLNNSIHWIAFMSFMTAKQSPIRYTLLDIVLEKKSNF